MTRFKKLKLALPSSGEEWDFWVTGLGVVMFVGGLITQVCLALAGNPWAVAYIGLPILLGGLAIIIVVVIIEERRHISRSRRTASQMQGRCGWALTRAAEARRKKEAELSAEGEAPPGGNSPSG